MPLTVRLSKPPPRERRLLFDQWHSVRYPPAYVPRDDLAVTDEMLDWTGDHLHTNMRDLFVWLREQGYFVETLGGPYTSFDATHYAALLLVDAEAEYSPEEARKLRRDVLDHGLSLVVLADWYNLDVLRAVRFFNDNTQTWWTPITGGANVPALNELLGPFGVAFGDAVVRGEMTVGSSSVQLASASALALPRRRVAGARALAQDEGARLTCRAYCPFRGAGQARRTRPRARAPPGRARGSRRFGDSDFVDSVSLQQGVAPCWWLLHAMLDFACEAKRDRTLFPDALRLASALHEPEPLPARPNPQSSALRRWAHLPSEPTAGIIASAELQRIETVATEELSITPSPGVVRSIVSDARRSLAAPQTISGTIFACAVVASLLYIFLRMRGHRRATLRRLAHRSPVPASGWPPNSVHRRVRYGVNVTENGRDVEPGDRLHAV